MFGSVALGYVHNYMDATNTVCLIYDIEREFTLKFMILGVIFQNYLSIVVNLHSFKCKALIALITKSLYKILILFK